LLITSFDSIWLVQVTFGFEKLRLEGIEMRIQLFKNKYIKRGAALLTVTALLGGSFYWGNSVDDLFNEASSKPAKKEISFDEFVKDFTKQQGAINTYRDEKTGSVYFSITEELLDKAFVYAAQIENGNFAHGWKRGDFIDPIKVKFEKKNQKIRLVRLNTKYVFDQDKAISRSKNSNISPAILFTTKIEKTHDNEKTYLIKVDDLLLSNALIHLDSGRKKLLGSISKAKSMVEHIEAEPTKLSLLTQVVFDNVNTTVSAAHVGLKDSRFITLEIASSFILDSEFDGYQSRKSDARIGFFAMEREDQSTIEGWGWHDVIKRWRLEKKQPQQALSEPVKPITFWLENTTPVQYRDIIVEAVERWNIAFEQAGFKNAVVAKIQPDDAEWGAADLDYNVIRWVASPRPAYGGLGPSQGHPETGEIFAADIMLEASQFRAAIRKGNIWSENKTSFEQSLNMLSDEWSPEHAACQVNQSLQTNIAYALPLISDEAEKEELIKQSLQYLILHEVGHTLGLSHNMKASSAVSFADLNNKSTQEAGLIPSVMDYPAVNTLAFNGQGYFLPTQPGAYDIWAIQYGYMPEMSDPEVATKHLARSHEKLLAFDNDAADMRGVGKGMDPRINIDDLSDDPVEFASYQVAMDIELLNNLKTKYLTATEKNSEVYIAYMKLHANIGKQIGIMTKQIGGIYIERSVAGQTDIPPYQPVSKAAQIKAIDAILATIVAIESIEYPQEVLQYLTVEKRGFSPTYLPATNMHKSYGTSFPLLQVFASSTLNRLVESQQYGNELTTQYVIDRFVDDIFLGEQQENLSVYRQMLQSQLIDLMTTSYKRPSLNATARAEMFAALSKIKTRYEQVIGRNKNSKANNHWRMIVRKIDKLFS